MTIPESLSTKKKNALNHQYHIKRPDADNLTKWVKDILTDAGVYRDDSLVATEVIQKIYSYHPRTELSIVPAPQLSILYEPDTYQNKDNSNGK